MEEPPPPPPMLRAPPALPDEIVEEVLIRSPPYDPASLVRAALVCKRWSRLVSARAFRRRFRDFHLRRRAAPMLGYFRNVYEVDGSCYAPISRFVRTSASCPPLNTRRGWHALDARGGCVLLHHVNKDQIRLAVWDPHSTGGGHLELPVPILPRRPRSWNAALLCCDQHGLQDHADGPFRVVLVGTDHKGAFACVYSSVVPAAWSEVGQYPDHRGVCGDGIKGVRGALVGNTIYFLIRYRTRILRCDLTTGDIAVIPLPQAPYSSAYIQWVLRTGMVLTTTEDGGLGFAGVVGSGLHLWSMVLRPNGGALAMEFTQARTIYLSCLPTALLGFADDAGKILLATSGGLALVDEKSGRIDKLVDGRDFCHDGYGCIVPYVSFYTPALVTTSTDEGTTADA